MLGETEIVQANLAVDPSVADVKGPHGISLFYHVSISGRVELIQSVHSLAKKLRPRDINRSLYGATNFGHQEMVEWLLKNGVTNVN